MNEIPRADGGADHEVSDSEWGAKAIRRRDGEAVTMGPTWYRDGRFVPPGGGEG